MTTPTPRDSGQSALTDPGEQPTLVDMELAGDCRDDPAWRAALGLD